MRENQPKHRQLRREGRRLERKKATRAGLPTMLIVCEGKETEPNYLRGLCEAHGINRANVTVVPGDGETNAARLVQKARRRFDTDRDFDAVFVICDCAGEDLADAQILAGRSLRNVSGQPVTIEMIVSRPSFEFWLLLHFEYASRPFSTATSVIDILQRHITDYDKADRLIFSKVGSGLDRALGNVARLKAELAAVGAQSPDTDMPNLIQRLNSVKRKLSGGGQ
jgi:hypothetical protein